jgi:hypothetical protein
VVSIRRIKQITGSAVTGAPCLVALLYLPRQIYHEEHEGHEGHEEEEVREEAEQFFTPS